MKHSYKKASYSDTKSVLVYTCDEGGPACIHKQYTSDLSTHNQYIKRGCPLLAKSSLKGDAADDSNSAYVKAPPQSVKNKKSWLSTFFFSKKMPFFPWVCCITAKTRGVRSVWAQHRLITMSFKKWPKPLNAFLHAVVIKTHRLLSDTKRNKGKLGVPEPTVLGSAGEQQPPQQQWRQQQRQGKKPSFITSDN